MSIIFGKGYIFESVPVDNEYMQQNGTVGTAYLYECSKSNKIRAKEFEIALNAVCATHFSKNVKVSWVIEDI